MSASPRQKYAAMLRGATVVVGEHPEIDGPIELLHVAFSSAELRSEGLVRMQQSGYWTSLLLYLDTAGPAIQAIRNPKIGPIGRYCSITR